MDFGFEGFLDKFEQHLGSKATKALLIVVGLGVAAVCVGAIWEWIVAPILNLIGAVEPLTTTLQVVLAVLSVTLAMLIVVTKLLLGRTKKMLRETEVLLAQTNEALERGHAAAAELQPLAETLLERAKELKARGG